MNFSVNHKLLILLKILVLVTFIESKRIAGGNLAERGDFPWHAKLEPFDGTFRKLCGGGLIRYNWIVTAAQCIYNSRDVIVRLGVIDRLEGPESIVFWVRNQNHIIIHENYRADSANSIYENDIGLIYLEDATEDILYDYVGTVSLPTDKELILYGENGVVTGFGFQNDDDEALQSMKLRYVDMDVLTTEQCVQAHGITVFTDGHLCTNTTGARSTCLGDEGGPLVVLIENNPTIIGVGSTPQQKCTVGSPAIFTNIVTYLEWILDNVDEPIPTPPPPTPPPNNGDKCNCVCNCYTCPPKDETTTVRNSKTKVNTFWNK